MRTGAAPLRLTIRVPLGATLHPPAGNRYSTVVAIDDWEWADDLGVATEEYMTRRRYGWSGFGRTWLGLLPLLLAMSTLTAAPLAAQDAAPAPDEAGADVAPEPETAAAEPAPEEPPPAAPSADATLTEARGRIATGETLFEQGNFDAALAEFQRAGELLEDHPAHFLVLYNIGKCYEQLFRYGDAMQYYQRYLDEGGAGQPDAPEVRAKIQLLESLLGYIHVTVSNAEHYEVWVDGSFVGNDVERILVPGGSHQVEVRADGFQSDQQEVQLPARERRDVEFELEALAEAYEGLSPGLFWAATGLAGASLIGGLAVGLAARGKSRRVDDALADSAPGSRLTGISVATQSERDRIGRLALLADIMYGATALFGAAALGLAFATHFGGDDHEPERVAGTRVRLDWGAAPTREGGNVWLMGRF